jgi:hypothetical protein
MTNVAKGGASSGVEPTKLAASRVILPAKIHMANLFSERWVVALASLHDSMRSEALYLTTRRD